MKNVKYLETLAAVAAIGMLTATAATAAETETPAEVTEYVVATEGAYPPFNLVNENNEPDGYDVAVMKAIDELYPEVSFSYQAVAWDGIFTALDAGKVDVIASQCGKNEEREAKYLFPEYPYTKADTGIVFAAGRTDITSNIEDLAGKTVAMGTGNKQTTWLEEYNEANPDKAVNILYTDGDISKTLQEIINGRADAHIASIKVTADYVINEQGLGDLIQTADFHTMDSAGTYMVLRQDETGEALKAIIDEGLKTLAQNGTLSEISEEYLGGDYAPVIEDENVAETE